MLGRNVDELVSSVREGSFRPGPLWFVEALLAFSFGYAFLSPPQPPRVAPGVERDDSLGDSLLFGFGHGIR